MNIEAESAKQEFLIKLIGLYKQHECLWNIHDKYFFDFPRKRQCWQAIADEMGPLVTVDYAKNRIYTIRYWLSLQHRQEKQRSKISNCVAKLFCTENPEFLQFLSKGKLSNKNQSSVDKTEAAPMPGSNRPIFYQDCDKKLAECCRRIYEQRRKRQFKKLQLMRNNGMKSKT